MKHLKRILILAAMLLMACMTAFADVGGYAQTGADRFNHNYQLTGNKAIDIVNIALAQEGKNGSSLGYTYDWCAAFVIDCAYYAGAGQVIPFVSGHTHAVSSSAQVNNGLYQYMLTRGATQVSDSEARAGDIIFLGPSNGYNMTHVGIMIDNYNTIEGNVNGSSYLTRTVSRGTRRGEHVILRPNYEGAVSQVLFTNMSETSITENNVSVYAFLSNYSGSNITNCYLTMWDSAGNQVAYYPETTSVTGDIKYSLNVGLRTGVTLQPGTTYTYQLSCSAAGTTFYSDKRTFKTTGVSPDHAPPSVSNVMVTDVTNDGYTVTCNISDDIGVTRVAFPTKASGESDYLWKDGTISGNTAYYRVSIADHNNFYGDYRTDVYAYDAAGNVSTFSISLVATATISKTYTLFVKTCYNGDITHGYGAAFVLNVNGITVSSADFSYIGSFAAGSTYAVTPGMAFPNSSDRYDGVSGGSLSGTINSDITLLLHYSEKGTQVTSSALPDGVTSENYDIEYRNYEEQIATSSPGSGWLEDTSYVGAYVNSGSVYWSDLPLETSNTRVDAPGGYYYHYCSGSTGLNCEHYSTSKYPHGDRIDDLSSVYIAETHTDGLDSRYNYYTLKWNDGSYAYCQSGVTCDGSYGSHGHRSYYWYRMYAYQDRVQQKRYIKDTGWTSTMPADGKYSEVRYTYNPPVSTIKFNNGSVTIARGDTLIPAMTLLPETATNADLIWTSNNPDIVTVDENGKMTAVSLGSTYITASSASGDISDTLHVDVTANVDPSSLFVVDGISVGFFGDGIYGSKMGILSYEGLVCMIREPGDILTCSSELKFTNDCDGYIVEYEVTEGNILSASAGTYVISKNTDRMNVLTAHLYEADADGEKGAEMAVANMVIFVIKNESTFTLPSGLLQLEANALDGTAATIIRLPEHVALEENSLAGLPVNTMIYFNSDTISPFYDMEVLGTGEPRDPNYYWIDTGTPTEDYYNGNGCCANYYCLGTAGN